MNVAIKFALVQKTENVTNISFRSKIKRRMDMRCQTFQY